MFQTWMKFVDTSITRYKDTMTGSRGRGQMGRLSRVQAKMVPMQGLMSGKYIGVQTIIREQYSHVTFIQCAAHSLNLVGKSANLVHSRGVQGGRVPGVHPPAPRRNRPCPFIP